MRKSRWTSAIHEVTAPGMGPLLTSEADKYLEGLRKHLDMTNQHPVEDGIYELQLRANENGQYIIVALRDGKILDTFYPTR